MPAADSCFAQATRPIVADQIVAAYQARGDATLGARGRQVAREQYTWDKVAPALLRVYDSLLC